ncbi:uncharacterized protein [Primulina huaijiensis]|uniref:uncharacterized protein n=1 Tax=Primulina huaijiensis TaxID=1492673 RepID=UPI003CC6F9A1
MANPQFTFYLGRSGQDMVKETAGVSDGGILSTLVRLGSKRSLAESFGTSTDYSYYSNNERTRGDMSERSDMYNINLEDSTLDPEDLRLKLTCKRISRRMKLEIEEREKAELHEKVSGAARALESPERSLSTKIPSSSGAAGPPKMDSTSSSYSSHATNEARFNSPERFAKYSSGFLIPGSAVDQLPYLSSIRHMDASRTSRFLISDPLECSAERSFLANIPLSRGAAEPPPMDPVSSYTSWAISGARPKSSDRVATYFNGFSAPRTAVDELSHVPSIRHMDASRAAQFLISDALECSAERSFLTNIPLSRGAAEPRQMDPVSNYTSWASSGETPQSSNRVATYFNGFSAPRTSVDQLPHVPSIRHMDASRTAQFLISDLLECSAEGSFLTSIPLSGGAAEPPQMDPVGSYTSRATSGERPQSSDRAATYFNGFSTPRTAVDLFPHVPSIRHVDASRTAQFLISDPLECSAEWSSLTNIPLSRGAAEPPPMDPVSSYTSWATSGVRPHSSDRVAKYFNGFSAPTAVDKLPHVPSIRPTDASRTAQFLISDPLELPKFPSPTMSMALEDFGKLVKELPPVTGRMFKAPPFTDILSLTVNSLLHSLGLEKYAINFQAEEIDMVALKQMGELDLKELGIPMGPRKKILSALHSRTMRPMV